MSRSKKVCLKVLRVYKVMKFPRKCNSWMSKKFRPLGGHKELNFSFQDWFISTSIQNSEPHVLRYLIIHKGKPTLIHYLELSKTDRSVTFPFQYAIKH